MATETWWHGQEHYTARMGEASWHARLQNMQSLMATAVRKAQSTTSWELQWPCATIPRRSLRRIRGRDTPSIVNILRTLLLAIVLPIRLSTAAFINFDNCLSPDIINSNEAEPLLQFVPLFVWATFNTSAKSYNLNVTAYGNVTGIATKQPYPDMADPQWKNPNDTVGKIPDVFGSGPGALYTTFTTEFNVLDYTPYAPEAARFCNTSSLTPCPLAPVFNFSGNQSDVSELPGITAAHDMYSSYAFTSINIFLRLKSGDPGADPLACVEASVTPDLGHTLSRTLTYLPLVVLILVAIATATAAVYSPWGSTDVFKFTSNYGRDDDLLRLVTPGFGDCLQYIQFIVLIGSLSLNYPGFYQPVVSRVSWSALMFNESFVTHGNGSQSLLDGIYVANGSYGLDRMSQLVGMTADKDIWAGMVVWLLVIVVAVITLIQIGFACRWAYRFISDTQEEDLRQKNLPLSLGNAIRVVFNYFLLPIVALSTFQLVIAGHSPGSTVGFAALLLVALIGFAGFLLWLIATTRPRSYLFDDLPTVLLYGPLYNTYSDNAATFALVPVMLTFIRGIAIGAVQPSGIAQLVLLAICEVINILTLNAFRPFHSPTSMNAFHTFFAVVRLLTVLLSVAFLPSLGVKDAPRGWIGYIILLMHAIVLVFGFFLNACQTLIEVIARLAGAGGEEGVGGGAARGGLVKVFGMRQLSRRNPRRSGRARQSINSDATMLAQESDRKSLQWNGGRSRSMSGSSAILLNRQGASDVRTSVGLDSVSAGGAGDTPVSGDASAFSYLPGGSQATGQGATAGGIVNLRNAETADPYYRPPRQRRTTMDANSPHGRNRGSTRGSWSSADWANKRWSPHSPDLEGSPQPTEGPSASERGTPLPAHLGGARDRSDSDAEEPRQSKTDYATREVDFYYGVRGPALSNQPTRRLKTGPADPTGPIISATGWIKNIFGGKTKEKGKGFEVVRSSRAPPIGRQTASGEIMPGEEARYLDEPGVKQPERSRDLALSDQGDAIGAGTRHLPDEESPVSSEDEEGDERSISDEDWRPNRESQISQFPPTLPTIETPGGIELPSRIASKASSRPTRESTRRSTKPNIPRKSSRRDSSTDLEKFGARLSTVAPSPPTTPQVSTRPRGQPPEDNSNSKRLPFFSHHSASPSQGTHLSAGGDSMNSSMFSPGTQETDDERFAQHARHSSSVLGTLGPGFQQLDRPTSMGYVQQHRASDNIHTARSDGPSMLGSSAELVEGPGRRSISPDTQQAHAF